jgi:hypothetical protein
MIKELFVLALATIAGVIAAYSEELFRAIITAGIFLLYVDMPRE